MNVDELLASINGQQIRPYLVEDLPLDLTFTTFVAQFCQEIRNLIGTEETVNADLEDFKLELSSFLRELQCPFDNLISGDSVRRLESHEDRLCLLEFLSAEHLAAKKVSEMKEDESGLQDMSNLHGLLCSLKLSDAPNDVQLKVLFPKIIERIQSMPDNMKSLVISQPLFTGGKLSAEQWKQLEEIAKKLEAEYALRRTMLITRLSATLQSFSWSDKAKQMPKKVAETLSMSNFNKFSCVTVADVLASRKDLLMINKISSQPPETRTNQPLTKIKVGRVPDRGGRASEMAAPPPEMPSWQQRSGQAHDTSRNFSGQGHQQRRPDRQGGYGGGGQKNHHNKNRGVQGAGWKRN